MTPDAASILVVEDDDEVRCLLQREITELGYAVTAVEDAGHALELLASQPFAIVITDIRMPGMDGVELTRQIRQSWPGIEVIIITGFASIDSATRAIRLGACDYLTKPFGDIRRIHESIDLALARIAEHSATRLKISALLAQRDSLQGLLDHLPIGVLLIDGAGKVVLSNRSAAAILAPRDGLILEAQGRLRGHCTEHTEELRRLVDGAAGRLDHQPRLGGATTLPRPSGKAPLSLLVTPLNAGRASFEAGEPVTAIFVGDPAQRAETAESLLSRLYGLTPAEARVAAILMQGKGAEEAGQELAMSTNTARTHIKHIFQKTQTKNQGDLISLLLSGPALLRLEQEGS